MRSIACCLVLAALSAAGETVLLDFSRTDDLRVTPSMRTCGEGRLAWTNAYATAGTKCFYIGTPPDVQLKYTWAVGVVFWKDPVDFTPYDRAVVEYVNPAPFGDSLVVCFGGRKTGSQTVEILSSYEPARMVLPLSFQSPAAARAVTNVIFSVSNPGTFECFIDRIVLLKKGEAVPAPRTPTAEEQKRLAAARRFYERQKTVDAEARTAADRAVQSGFRERLRAANRAAGFDTSRMLVGWAASTEQVRPTVTEVPVRVPTDLSLRLARGEKESLQVYVMPSGEEPLRDVSVALEGDLQGDAPWWRFGCGVPRLAATNVEICAVGYLDCVRRVNYKYGYTVKTNAAPGYVRTTKPCPKGWYPDPLLSFKRTTDVAPFVAQGFWVRVRCPEDQPAGTYRGTLTVGGRRIPLTVRVNGFTLPRESPLPLAITFGPMVWTSEKTLSKEEHAERLAIRKDKDAPVNAWLRHREQWCDFLADYYIMPNSIYHSTRPLPNADKLVQYRREGRLGWFNLGYWFEKPDEANAKRVAWWERDRIGVIKANYEEAKRLGILDRAYIYGCDEAPRERHARMAQAIDLLHELCPGVPVCTTGFDPDFGLGKSLLKGMDWFMPLTSKPYYWSSLDKIAEARKAGKKVWWYVACGEKAPMANLVVETSPHEIRNLLGAQSWRYKADGFLYFESTIWNGARPIQSDTSTFTTWNPESWRKGSSAHGDGTFVYPGPDSTPLASIHLENLRDGVEDYAYLKLLSDRLAANPSAPWAARAKELLAVPESVLVDLANFNDDPVAHYAWRDAIADLLETPTVQAEESKGENGGVDTK